MSRFCLNKSNYYRTPFDWRTPFGYLIAMCGLFPAIYYIFLGNTCNLCLAIGTCCFMIAFGKDIGAEMTELNHNAEKTTHRAELYKKICDISKFHVIAKQLSSLSNRMCLIKRRFYTIVLI